MREILFKAKAINRDKGYYSTSYKNGDWVYGLITRLYDERFESLPAEMTDENGISGIEIDHNTICQYTGLTDKNGKKIWENDIVSGDFGWHKGKYIIQWWNDEAKFSFPNISTINVNEYEVIGNVFDNPELLKGE